MFYTSYLANIAKIRDSYPGWRLIAITRFRARSPVSPSAELLAKIKLGEVGWEEYKARYHLEMQGQSAQAEMNRLRALDEELTSQGQALCLLCYEKRYVDQPLTDFHCHRVLLANLLVNGRGMVYGGDITRGTNNDLVTHGGGGRVL